IHNEHPQTIAVVLSHLNPTQAASLLESLPQQLRSDVAVRMASLDQISTEIIQKIAVVIGHKLQALGEFSRESYGGVRAVAEMLREHIDALGPVKIRDVEGAQQQIIFIVRQLKGEGVLSIKGAVGEQYVV